VEDTFAGVWGIVGHDDGTSEEDYVDDKDEDLDIESTHVPMRQRV